MNRVVSSIPFLFGAALLLSACASQAHLAARPVDVRPKPAVAQRVPVESAEPAANAAAAEPNAASPAASPRAVELGVWNARHFRERFAESYMAETDIEPRVTVDERERMLEVLELISSDDLDGAAKLLAKERDEDRSAVFDFTLANLHFQGERLEQAAEGYEVSVEKFPRFRRAWRNLGVIRVRQGDFPRAIPALTRVVELGGGDATTFGLLGYALSSTGNPLSAETAYRMAALLDPSTMDWKMGLARCFFDQKRFADASALCDGLIEAQPDRADLWLLQANAFLGLGTPERAAENYEIVERLGKSTPESLDTLGDIYVNQELYELAVSAYARGLEKGSGPQRAMRAAKVLASRGALDQARPLLDAIEAAHGSSLEDGEKKDLLKLRARVAVAAGAGEEEARILEEIVALDPLDGEALILLGQHESRAGHPDKAIFCFERAANLEAFEADAKVRHAQLLVGQGRYSEALPLLRRAQAVDPRDNVQDYLEQVERVARSR